MENFWLLIFAGGTIGLLGTFLFTSERELGKKRREIEYFRRQHAENAGGPAIESQPSEAQSELAAKNQQLIEQIASLTGRLEESQRMTKELEAERHRLLTARSENDELQKIVANLQSRLQASEARFS